MEKPVVVAAKRTPIGKFLGQYADVPAVELGAHAARAVLAQTDTKPSSVDLAVFGHARQAGCGPNPGRQAAAKAGLPHEVPAFTLNQACASGLAAVALAAQEIQLGRAHAVLAGGMENMTRVPFLLDRARTGYRLGNAEIVDAMYRDGFLCPLSNLVMGETAENLVERYGIPREEQDAYAVETQRRCEAARKSGRYADETAPFEVKARGKPVSAADEHPRDNCTMADMAKLSPVFRKEGGTIHPGNASGITDGGAALLVVCEDKAKKKGLPILAYVEDWVTVGVDPRVMGIGPVPAVRKLMERLGRKVDDYDLVELNEAFAAQVLACDRELKFPRDRLNVNGGAIALGHPIGCTGARVAVTLLHEMQRRKARLGLATLCVSGGLGIAMSFRAP